MTGYRRPSTDTAHAIGTDEQGANEPYGTSRTPIVMIRIARLPRRNASSHIRKAIRRMKKKRDGQARRPGKTAR